MRDFTSAISSTTIAPVRPRDITYKPRSSSEERASNTTSVGSKRSACVTMNTIIKAPVETCFDLVSRQFKEAPRWDPTVRWVVPISSDYIRVGSQSRFIFDLAGSIDEATVVLRSLVPNETIVWTSNHRTRLKEEWHFERKPDGTVVTVTLSYNPARGLMKYLTRPVRKHSQIEQAVSEMLRRLKMAAELPKPRYL